MRLDEIAVVAPEVTKRLEHFRSFTMAHPRLVQARDALMDAIDGAAPGSLVFVLGPTGVGKTTLRMKIEDILTHQMARALAADPGHLPFVSVEVVPPDSGRFRWRDYFRRLLAAMHEPLIGFKSLRGPGGAPVLDAMPSVLGNAELGFAVEQALRYRHPPAVFVDEAQHLARIASGRRLSDQLDVIKSIANRTGTVHVLLGTYELLAFRNLSAQLSRRSMDLHFERYRADSPEDRQVFRSVLLTFQKQLPFATAETDLIGSWELLYERSVGCVGILKEWLMRACVRAIKHGAVSLTLEHLESTALSISQCEKILAESRDGETRLNDHEDARQRFRTLLGLDPQSQGRARSTSEADGGPPAQKRKRGRPPKRAPVRDPVTQEMAAACV
jgi:energy-coupling factor transporter ATP-binding protein EcfA2